MKPRVRVLIVDDEELIGMVLERAIELATAEEGPFDMAGTFGLAREILEEHEFDVVLCDLHLLDGNAMRLEGVGRTPASRFVWVTGGAFNPDEDAFLANRKVILKPFEVHDVVDKVTEVLASH